MTNHEKEASDLARTMWLRLLALPTIIARAEALGRAIFLLLQSLDPEAQSLVRAIVKDYSGDDIATPSHTGDRNADWPF